MKKMLFLSVSMLSMGLAFGQLSKGPSPAAGSQLPNRTTGNTLSTTKSLSCVDTLRYTQAKEQILGTNAFYTFQLWQSDAEAITMTYLHSGSTATINQIEVFGRKNASSTVNVTLQAAIYSVNASYTPTTLLGSGTVTISSTTANYYYITLSTPVTVSSNYAVVIQPTNTNAIFDAFVNNITPNQTYDEVLARYKSNYYTNSAGAYVSIPTLTTGDAADFPSGPYNFEPIVAPILSYNINTTASATPTSVCVGSPVSFTGGSTPSGLLSNRFYNYQIFRTFFGTAANDSTHAWDFDDNSAIAWINPTATHTYATAGTYAPTYYTLGGFWNSCVDFGSTTVTVNALPTVTASATSTPICSGASTTLNPSGAVNYSWNNGIGAVTSPTVSPTATTTYTVTGTDANNCSNTGTVTVNVNPVLDATFSYASSTVCLSSGNIFPTASNLGTFTVSAPGLVLANSATGEINVGASTAGTYTVTNTTSGACPDVKTFVITLTNSPSAVFSYTQTAYCTAENNPSPVFANGASAGTFSATPAGLAFNASTGLVDLANSATGSYTVTNAIAAGGGCTATSATFAINVTQSPTITAQSDVTVCNGAVVSAINFNVTPANATVSWNNSNTTTGLSAASGTGNINAFNASNATSNALQSAITYSAINGTCSSGSQSFVITVNPTPNVTIAPVAAQCTNNASVTLNAVPAGGTFAGLSVTGNNFDPAIGAGTYNVTYNITDLNGCSGSNNIDIVVNAEPNVTLGSFSAVCLQANAFTLTGGLPAGGNYSGNGTGGGMFNPANAGLGTSTITYSFTDVNGCSSAASQDILVDDCAGIEEQTWNVVNIYPNPAQHQVTLQTTESLTVSMRSADGKLVLETISLGADTSITLDVSSFAKGVYYLQIENASNKGMKELVIQ